MLPASPTLLAVDDEPRLLNSMRDLLSLNGYEVDLESDSRNAIERLRTGHYDIALLDLKMPHVNGQQIMQYVAQHNIPTDIIVISGEASFETAVEALRLGAHDFLTKPYTPEQLLKRLDNTLAQRRLRRDATAYQKRLRNSEKLHRFLVNTSPDIIYVLNEEGCFTFLNKRVTQLLGFTRDDLIDKHYTTLVHEEDQELARFTFNERRTGKRATHNVELRLRTKGGSGGHRSFSTQLMCIELNAIGLYSSTGHDNERRHVGTYGVARDISERKQAEETIRYQAHHDLLTGLPNRTLFKDRLNMMIAQARRTGHKVAVMFIDLDRFKIVNDTLGHVIGDQLLRAAGQSMQECLRDADTLARLGGDEFVILLPQVTDHKSASAVSSKIIAALKQPFVINQRELFISASIGIAMFPDDGSTDDELIKNADIAMYSVKNDSRGGYAFYAQAMGSEFSQHMDLEMDLRRALSKEEFAVYYQPQFDTTNRRIVGIEALLRWQHPERGMLYPDSFIPLAEEIDLISRITLWVLDATTAQMRQWMDAGIAPPRLAVNLSALDLKHTTIVDETIQTLQRHGVPGNRLELEITETLIAQDITRATHHLTALSHHGINIAIDDFGTGYSSLNYLHRLPIHTLKIDRSFVRDIAPERNERSVIDAIIVMAHGFNLKVIAEGVETEAQRDWLEQRNCHTMQGYLFSRPLPVQDIEELLRASQADQENPGLIQANRHNA
ncbi:putative bifunctional diguanylate cyclase/phosphodiesterase [Acidihalobacter ferrooxydans]|uniref:cyclic-guanylate-specific phosphodiesterase n=1 Tax=Acidihalobacter ferrooxydans TaxID=1765967 RepID=A0A1P8UEM0_9GAMM|nr:EAL domain-containing protein [Acidihalobacter ferrooxydans]APZ42214.1 hypothetical protein BW247_03155 [Acidihalobacter ferrooxydans]